MTIKVGDKIPSVILKHLGADGMEDISTDDLLSNKKTVLFAVPGAFTPTCSAQHVPGFLAQASAIKAKGVDQIVCLSVNDAFVMNSWGKDRGTGEEILMLGDGNGDLTRAMDLTLDGSGFGLGIRSQRYAMIIQDGSVTALEVEEGPGLNNSSAENILGKL